MKASAADTKDEDPRHEECIQRVLELRKALKVECDASTRENLWTELIVVLEKALMLKEQDCGDEIQLLEEISRAYYELVQLNLDSENHWLDWAIACKRAGTLQDCVMAHKKRMELCNQYKTTDAVRLLGLSSDGSTVDMLSPCESSLFEQCNDTNESTYRPSISARQIGARVRMIFENDFSLANCNAIIAPLISESCNAARFFSANSFFHHRHELDIHATQLTRIEVLSRLFLFGLAIPRQLAEDTIGKDSLDCLFQAGLLRTSPACETDIVGEVQIYPCPIEFYSQETFTNCWFMTDWPMESLRPTRDSIMSVGYDTLELMSLSAGLKPPERWKLLDLCCGCGIQGVFAALCNPATLCKLVCSDVNERACRFAAANMALNITNSEVMCYAVMGDLFENVQEKFDIILSNPPFVAMPSSSISLHTTPALFAIGGGIDGTEVLHRIVRDSVQYLEGDNAKLILVTELPNIESSCSLIQGFLPVDVLASIRIAYVGSDVETVQQYDAVRQAETSSRADSLGDWGAAQLQSGIRNRALALMTVSSFGKGNERCLYEYTSGEEVDMASDDSISSLDEEDAFLTMKGIEFSRSRLLYPHYANKKS